MSSAAYREFVHSVTGAITNRDRLESHDLHALASLEGAERTAALKLLTDRIAQRVNDPRGPAALRAVGAFEAVDALTAALPAYPADATKLEIAFTLWVFEGSQDALAVILDLLRNDLDPELRKRAANRTSDLKGEEERVDAELIKSIALDPDSQVRIVSELVLYERLSLEEAKDTAPCRAETIPALLYSSLSSVRSEGIQLLLALSRHVRSGGDPMAATFAGNDPAMVERFDDSWRSSLEDNADYDLEALRSFGGDAVPWAEDRLLRDLDSDPRGARALAVVGTPRVLTALREAAQQSDPDLAREAAAALSALTA